MKNKGKHGKNKKTTVDPSREHKQVTENFINFEKASDAKLSDETGNCSLEQSHNAELEKQDFPEANANSEISTDKVLEDPRDDDDDDLEIQISSSFHSSDEINEPDKISMEAIDDSANNNNVALSEKDVNLKINSKVDPPAPTATTEAISDDEEINKIADDAATGGEIDSQQQQQQQQPEISPMQPSSPEEMTQQMMFGVLETLADELEQIPEEKRRDWITEKLKEKFGDKVPSSLMDISVGHCFDGDSGLSVDDKPDWLDMDKFQKGQKFARDYIFGIQYADLISLFTVFSFEMGLKPLIYTGASSTPYTAFKRYLSTGRRVYHWYSSDPWTPGTEAHTDIKSVRKVHSLIRKELSEITREEMYEKATIKDPMCPALEITRRDFESTCPVPAPGQCPYLVLEKCPYSKVKKLSQGEMIATQFAFVGLVILDPKSFGIHYATDEDLEAFCHVWRGLGWLLGIEDRFNFCRGTLEDVRTRSRDFLNYWVKPNFRIIKPEWEHMMRCIIEGLQYYFPGCTYETCLLDLTYLMDLHMPRLYNSISYSLWLRHQLKWFYFGQLYKFNSIRESSNKRVLRAMERANNFDEEKHKQLQERSENTLNAYKLESQKEEVKEQEEDTTSINRKGTSWALRFFTQMQLFLVHKQ